MPMEMRRAGSLLLISALAVSVAPLMPARAEPTPAGPMMSSDRAGSHPAPEATTELTIPDASPATAPGVPRADEGSVAGQLPPAPVAVEVIEPATLEATPIAIDAKAALDRLGRRASSFDKRDTAGLLAAYTARQGAAIWMTSRGATEQAIAVAREIEKADDWGLKSSDFDLPGLATVGADAPHPSPAELADHEVRLTLAVLKYARHARGGRFEPTALTKYLDRRSPVLDPQAVLDRVASANEPSAELRGLHPRHAQFERLRQRYLDVRDAPAPKGSTVTEAARILANMEQWRWMPDELGAFHIWANIPEYQFSVVRDGDAVHTERMVVGKTASQTPIFSDEMTQVIFHPYWGVPDSIKRFQVLPSLRGSQSYLKKYNLKIQLGGRDVDPRSIDWSATDIRRFHFYQKPGNSNVLGSVKFWFPNKHAVYMHDTPSKSLFKAPVRTFSAGCMRVQDPMKLAELILAEDRQMSPEQVRALVKPSAPENNQLNLSRRVPVHITYFTMSIDAAGNVSTFKDVYGHEERIRLGLEGKMHLVKAVPEPADKERAEALGQIASSRATPAPSIWSGGSSTQSEWARRAFSGGFANAGN
jgi:murein L,D-transpeptidase YcbB/YkuD